MLMMMSTPSQASFVVLSEFNPSAEYPFIARVRFVKSGINPRGLRPELELSITSAASQRAIASAIGLRQAFPMQTNSTFVRADLRPPELAFFAFFTIRVLRHPAHGAFPPPQAGA